MEQPDPGAADWSLTKKLLFFLFFIFFVLYIFLNPNHIVPYTDFLNKVYIQPFANLTAWLAKDVLHIVNPAIKFYNGTIDSVFGYLSLLFIFLLAISGSLIWLAIDRRAHNYHKQYSALTVLVRYYLAFTMIAYASFKIIKIQFLSLSPVMLLQTYGNSTPRQLAWSFLGYSAGYNYFMGSLEFAAGLLLFFRRTTTLGSIIVLGILANVIAVNFSFDINVKLYSIVLVMMALFLLSKDVSRLYNFFFLNKIVYPFVDPPIHFKKKWENTALLAAKYVFILYVILFGLRANFYRTFEDRDSPVKPPLYGIYNVTAFIRNKDTIKPLTTDTTRWDKLIVSAPKGNASIKLMDGSVRAFEFRPETAEQKIVMYAKSDTSDKYTFTYDESRDSVLVLQGRWHNDSLQIKFRQYDFNKFPLINHGFRWILDHYYHNK
jgi:hypothetical protein